MRPLRFLLLMAVLVLAGAPGFAATGEIIKVLPHYLDQQGRHTLSPSLFDRDAYQTRLRRSPELQSGLRFDVHWRARAKTNVLALRVELRGVAQGGVPPEHALTAAVKPGRLGARWSSLEIRGGDFRALGGVTAWRISLLAGEQVLSQQQSLLW